METFPQVDPYGEVEEMADNARFQWMHHEQVQLLEMHLGLREADGATADQANTDDSGATQQLPDSSAPGSQAM